MATSPAPSRLQLRPLTWLLALGVLAMLVRRPGSPPRGAAKAGGAERGCEPPASGAFNTVRASDEPEDLQHARAREPGRGRSATAPWEIPWQGWKDILWRTYEEIGSDRLLAIAAGVVFFGLLALFPAVTALVSVYGLVADYSTIADHLAIAASVVPSGGMEIIQEQVARVVAKGDVQLGLTFAFALALALWSANAGMKAIIDALNVVYDEDERRGFVALNLASLSLTLGALVTALAAIGAVIVFPLLLARLGLESVTETAVLVLRWPALGMIVLVGLAVLYRYAPSRREPRWEWVSVGSACATVLWLAGSALLSWYLANFAHYDATYGSLGAAIGLMMWMWVSAIVILFGAELNSEIEHQTARDSTVGPEKPMGSRDAVMADTVGEAKT